MSNKVVYLVGIITLAFFVIFIKPWGVDYYFPTSVLIFYFLSQFIKNGVVKYYIVIGSLFLLVLLVDSWLIDYLIPITLVIIIIFDTFYQLVNLIQAKFFKKIAYKTIFLLIPVFPILLVSILIVLERKNLHEIELVLPLTYNDILKKCKTGSCSNQIWNKINITKGITTMKLSYLYKQKCLIVTPSKNWTKINSYNSCDENVIDGVIDGVHGQGIPHQHDWVDGERGSGKPVNLDNPEKDC